jgi:hypothetical protein
LLCALGYGRQAEARLQGPNRVKARGKLRRLAIPMLRPLADAPPAWDVMMGRPVSAAGRVFLFFFFVCADFFLSGLFFRIFGSAGFFLGFLFFILLF